MKFYLLGVSLVTLLLAHAETSYFETFAMRQDMEHAELKIEASQRQLKDRDWDYQHYDVGFKFDSVQDWSVAANLRLIYRKDDDGKWDVEKRPYIQATKSFENTYGKLSLRNRYEYRVRHNSTESKRVRTRVELSPEYKIFNIKGFISSEVFYDFDESQATKNRLTLGLKLPKIYNTNSKLYYRHTQDSDDAVWLASNSLGFKIECKF